MSLWSGLAAVVVAASAQSLPEGCKQASLGSSFNSVVCSPKPDGQHYGKCLLMLPGRSNEFNFASVFAGLAAEHGYAAFSIQYKSDPDTFKTCSTDYDDLDCGEKVRLAKQVGGTAPHSISVPEDLSVDHRTRQALMYFGNLTEGQPTPLGDPEAFAQCLRGGEVAWDKVVAMGGSEGSGQAAFVGYHHEVSKVIMFSGIDDGVVYDLNAGKYDPPKWTTTKGKTPYSRYYGFGEVYDQACRAWRLNWGERAFDMPDEWVNVNLLKPGTSLAPYHKVCSDRTKSAAGHIATVWDKATPKVDGKYVYEPVWRALLGIADAAGGNGTGASAALLAPTPVAAGEAVRVASCDKYPSIKQLWNWDPEFKVLRLQESDGLVLDCGKCTAADREMKVSKLAGQPTAAQVWSFERNHFVHTASGLCLARNPAVEPGLVLLADCVASPIADISWTLSVSTALVRSADVCLSVQHSNTTKCQCHV